MLKIYLLGSFQLIRDEEVVAESDWHTKQARQLLKILLTFGGKIASRDYLIDILWPEADPDKAATTLRTAVNALRKTLEPNRPPYTPGSYILAHAPGYRFQFTDTVWLDVTTFETFLDEAAEITAPSQRERSLKKAIALYRDDYLADDLYEDWAYLERERLRERYFSALTDLAEIQAGQGNYERAISTLRRILTRDPGREPVYRDLMRHYLQLGDTTSALKTFEQLRAYLADELGADPSPQTLVLHQAVLNGQLIANPAAQMSQPALFETVFIGRQKEKQLLRQYIKLAQQGNGAMAALVGEAGVGKSRLAAEILSEVTGNVVILNGRGQTLEQNLPFAPIIEALESYLTLQSATLFDDLPQMTKAHLAALLPSFSWQVDHRLSLDGLSENNRQLVVNALTEALLKLAEDGLILFIDDLHWVDPATLTLLSKLSRYLPHKPIFVLLAYREEEIEQNIPLTQFLRQTKRQKYWHLLPLSRFSLAETETYLQNVWASASGTSLIAQKLHQTTGGNLLFITETVRALLDNAEDNQPEMWLNHPALKHPSAQITDVILARLGQLPPACQNILEIAAVIGRDFSLDLLEAVSTADPLPALDVLLQRQFLTETDPGRLDFSHQVAREVIYKSLSPLLKRRLHERVATALISLYGKQAGPKAAEISVHSQQAGLAHRWQAFRFAILGGDYALRVFGFEQAVRQYAQAIDLAESLSPSEELTSWLNRAYQGLGQAHESLAEWDLARTVYNQWRSWARKSGNLPVALMAQHRLAAMLGLIGQLDESAAISTRLIRQLPSGTPDVVWDVQERLGRIISTEADSPTWTEAGWPAFIPYPMKFERAWEEVAALMGQNQATRTLNLYGWGVMLQGHTDVAEATFNYAIQLAEQYNQPGLQAASYHLLAQLWDMRGDYARMQQALENGFSLVQDAPHLQWAVIWGRIHQAYVDMRWNQLERAETRLIALSHELESQQVFRSHQLSVQVGLGLVAMFRQDVERAISAFETVLKSAKNLYASNYVAVYLSRARLSRKLGQFEAAQQDIIQAMTFAGARGMLADYCTAAVEAARFDRATEQAHHIIPLLQKMEAMASQANLRPARLSIRLALLRVFEQLDLTVDAAWYQRLARTDRDTIANSISNPDDRAAYLSRQDLSGL